MIVEYDNTVTMNGKNTIHVYMYTKYAMLLYISSIHLSNSLTD